MGNQIRTTLLLAGMTALILLIGQFLGGRQGMTIALVLAAGVNFFSYWYSDKLVLRMYRAQEVSSRQAPELYGIVQTLARQASLPMPKVYIIPQETPNAFATGRNPSHAVVAVTEGLLNIMAPEEIKGVLAHELAHIDHRDILIGSVAATMAGAIMWLASMARWSALFGGLGGRDDNEGGAGVLGLLLMSILAPLAAVLIQMAISRSREYLADASGAQLAGHPEGLARALEKISAYSRSRPMKASQATAHMFIVNPLAGSKFSGLFATHPPVEERVARLRGTGRPAPPRVARKSDMEDQARAVWDRLSK